MPGHLRNAHINYRASYAGDPQTRRMGPGRDLTAVRKDGTEFPVEIGLGPVHAAEGLLIAAHVSDISARKEAETALRTAQEQLEERVTQRTAELQATNGRMAELSSRMLTLQGEERRRIGRELHDGAAQDLAAAAMNLTLVARKAPRLSAPAQRALSEGIALVDECARAIRTVSYLFHPPLLDEVGLAPAMRWYADGFAKRSGISVEVDASPHAGRLPEEAESALFRIVQECLTNIHRHADSATVRVQLVRDTNTIALKVEDRGRGIAAETLKALADTDVRIGVGIMGMRERVRQLGGQFEITSGGAGTVVFAMLPLPAAPPPET